jgi:hypothetical protein
MSGYAVVDVAIGLSFIFFLLSVVATAIVEAVAGVFKYRARALEGWLAQSLAGAAPSPESMTERTEIAGKVMNHPIIYASTKGTARPSYISADQFVIALLESGGDTPHRLATAAAAEVPELIAQVPDHEMKMALGKLWRATGTVEQFRPQLQGVWLAHADALAKTEMLVDDLPDGPLKQAMTNLWRKAGGDVERFRTEAEAWYDQAMDRLSGWYKRRTQLWLWIIGLAFAVILNVDTLGVAQSLWSDQTLRQLLTDQAQNASAAHVSVNQATHQLHDLPLPLGWGGAAGGLPETGPDWGLKAVGVLLTAAAVSMGAPFWFDSLSKLSQLRNTGPKPAR